ncbi:unnamed protein product [Owenia fusiformis]|uniref:Uncharacterized protein n=1 Tax=Owenia fusiformis TaxID=6347 RepID=A0A8J1TW53_OWEFU|nr:unnamed protein product [Owenia fusiformis]
MEKILFIAVIACAVISFSKADDISKKVEHALRQKRSLVDYGRWCGPANTPIGNRGCSCSTGKQTCRRRYPPKDGLDAACVNHDFCAHCSDIAGKSILRYCHCEERIYSEARRATCRTVQCRLYKASVQTLFGNIPCMCGRRVVSNFRRC